MIFLPKTIRSCVCLNPGSVCGNLEVAVRSKPDVTLSPGRPWHVLSVQYVTNPSSLDSYNCWDGSNKDLFSINK